MNGKKAKRHRREVREVLGMETHRVNGQDINKIGAEQYQVDGRGTIRVHPAQSRAVYRQYKKLLRSIKA